MDWLLSAWLSVLTPWTGSAWNVGGNGLHGLAFAAKMKACARAGTAHHLNGSA